VLGGFLPDITFARHLIAHEIAHNWCRGADVHSWEDWLNETTAEWTALLYQLHIGDMDKFDSVIQDRAKRAKYAPAIKTADGSRPDGVHDAGVILFYEIFKKYGFATIEKMLKLFDSLTDKSTDRFLELVDAKMGAQIAAALRNGVDGYAKI